MRALYIYILSKIKEEYFFLNLIFITIFTNTEFRFPSIIDLIHVKNYPYIMENIVVFH